MPFYEYQCEKCSEIYEIFLRKGDNIPESCEICGGKLHKIISASSFQLKGSGWYMTDYSKKNSSALEKGADSKSNGKNKDNSNRDSVTEQAKSTLTEKSTKKAEDIASPK